MPVYYSSKTYPANIIFFGGRRWVLTSEGSLFNLTQVRKEHPSRRFFPELTVATLEREFHGYHQALYTPFFISDPVDFETPDFQATPIGLGWSTVQQIGGDNRYFGPDIALKTVLTCHEDPPSCIGQPEDFCNPGHGKCNNETGLCDCESLGIYYMVGIASRGWSQVANSDATMQLSGPSPTSSTQISAASSSSRCTVYQSLSGSMPNASVTSS